MTLLASDSPSRPPSRASTSRPAPSHWGSRRRGRIGLLGGSFNPAHDGHLHISRMALSRLRLDAVWWLVSPGNPLKPRAGMAPFDARLDFARRVTARDPRIRVLDLENRWKVRLTAKTLARMRQRFPQVDFVWLMGADNLKQLPSWHRWREIVRGMPIAVFDRAPYSKGALAGRAARRFARYRIPTKAAGILARQTPPSWVFLPIRRHSASATAIRARGWDGFGCALTNGEDNN